MYLRLLVQDIRKDRDAFASGREQRLPRGLEEYFDRLVSEMGDDLSATMPAITTLLALAYEPLPAETLAVLLADHELVGQSDGHQLLDEALRHGSVMLSRAATSSGALGFTLYHESFRQYVVASNRIRRSRAKAQERLCRFATRWNELKSESPPLDYALRWGPRTLIDAQRWDDLENLLLDIFFLEAKCKAGMVFELADDFTRAVAAMLEGRSSKRILRLLEEAIRLDIHFISRHADDYPQALFQCLWNNGWWYDCDEAGAHYVDGCPPGFRSSRNVRELGEPLASIPCDEPGTIAYDQRLCRLLEQWRQQKNAATPNFPWLRTVRPPPIHLGTPLKAVLRGHAATVRSVAFSPDGDRIVSGSVDGTVRLWDAHRGTELKSVFWQPKIEVLSVSFSPDGNQIVTGAGDGTVRLLDSSDLAELAVLAGHRGPVASVAFSPNGDQIASGANDHTVRVWDVRSGVEVAAFRKHEGPVTSVAFSPDGTRIASGASWDPTVHVWDPCGDANNARLYWPQSGAERGILSRWHSNCQRALPRADGYERK